MNEKVSVNLPHPKKSGLSCAEYPTSIRNLLWTQRKSDRRSSAHYQSVIRATGSNASILMKRGSCRVYSVERHRTLIKRGHQFASIRDTHQFDEEAIRDEEAIQDTHVIFYGCPELTGLKMEPAGLVYVLEDEAQGDVRSCDWMAVAVTGAIAGGGNAAFCAP